jgi:bleomycin hydrolase
MESTMNRSSLIFLLLSLLSTLALAQRPTGISSGMLEDLRAGCPDDAGFRAAQHALAQTDGRKLTPDWEKINSVDALFSTRLKDQKITDQKSSGRCWMFSALNILRPVATRSLKCGDIEFSQNYLFFYDKLEKANLFLESIIRLKDKPFTDRYMEFLLRQPVQDGGNWLGFIELVKKYGVVPKEVMPETFSSSNSGTVNKILGMRLRQYALKLRNETAPERVAQVKLQALRDVYKILAMNFGLPPRSFTWRYEGEDKKITTEKTYTPQQFYRDVVHETLDDYYALYSIPTLAFDKKYEIDLDKAVYDRPNMFFVNCSLDTIKELARKCLLADQPVWFGCDVGEETNTEAGLMMPDVYDYASLYGMDFSMSRKELFETYSSSPNHNMVLTGVDIIDGKPAKWLVENSWGDKSGKKGYLSMTDAWFDKYVQVVVVHKKFIPEKILALFDTKPELLPPWDPMFKMLMMQE